MAGQQAERPPKRRLRGIALLALLILAALGTAVWANLWKSDMRVGEVLVEGHAIVPAETILALARVKKNDRLYDIDLFAVRKSVLANSFLRSAAVNRQVPDRIVIRVEERVPIAVLASGGMRYLDADGVVLPGVRSEQLFDLPLITCPPGAVEGTPGDRIAASGVREALAILKTAKDMDESLYLRISEIHVGGQKDLMLYTAEYGVPVLFGRGEIGRKLVKFDGFWTEVVKRRGAQDLEYVDLRFHDQVVVRWKREEGAETTAVSGSPEATGRRVKG